MRALRCGILWGIGLNCFACLLLEIALTRIFSAATFYHFTFLVIALALGGIGAAGVWAYLHPVSAADLPAALGRHGRRFALSTILGLVAVLVYAGELTTPSSRPLFLGRAALLIGAAALPFFFSGLIVAHAMANHRDNVTRIYFFDLAGAGVAAAAAGVLLEAIGGPSLVLSTALASAVAALLFAPRDRLAWAVAAGSALLLLANLAHPVFRLRPLKEVRAPLLFEKWNGYSRVTVEDNGEGVRQIRIDGSASTVLSAASDGRRPPPESDIRGLAYSAFDRATDHRIGHVAIVGAGGGADVASALAVGAERVVGIEVNPIIGAEIPRRFGRAGDRLIDDPRVHMVIDEGRSYLRRSSERFDVIQLSLVDTWAATAAGAFALTENLLYTVEAFGEFYDRLTIHGALTVTRWHRDPPREGFRLVTLAAGALERRGVPPDETHRYLFYARRGDLGTLVAKRTPIGEAELGRLEAACARGGFSILLSPRPGGDPMLARLLERGAARAGDGLVDLSPPTDDRPFFFNFDTLRRLARRPPLRPEDPSAYILGAIGLSLAALVLGFIAWPSYRRPRLRPAEIAACGYFLLIGLGFIAVEMALLQKLMLHLGHPAHALRVVLFSLLAGTAIGARLGDRWSARSSALLAGVAVAGLALAASGSSEPLLRLSHRWPGPLRVFAAGSLVGLCGLPMGMMAPAGIRLIDRLKPELVAWAWGMSGAAAMVGTVAATVISLYAGIGTLLRVAALVYLMAAGTVPLFARRGPAVAGEATG